MAAALPCWNAICRDSGVRGRRRAFVCVMAVSVLPVVAVDNPPALCAGDIVAKMNQTEQDRDRTLTTYTALRHYMLRDSKGRAAQMTVRLSYHTSSGKSFEVLSQNGADGIFGHVLEKVMQAEAENSRNKGPRGELISPLNYDFRLLGMGEQGGRRCYVIQLLPKRKSKFLIDGEAWIDSEDFALVRMEGRTAASVSFWIGRPWVVQCFEKVGNYWLASKNDSVADAKFIGRTELTVESSDYSVPGLPPEQVAQRLGTTVPRNQ